MFAIIKSGGKQYKVKKDSVIRLEKISKADIGKNIEFDQVLMLEGDQGMKMGNPLIEGAKVTAEVLSQGRHKKIRIIKFRRRKHSMKHQGHRQYYPEIKIIKIQD
jgi:large subunit ribosomal protein L21